MVWYGMVWYCMYARDVCSIFHTHSTLQFYFSLLPTWTYLPLLLLLNMLRVHPG